jgi:hypothetical protein
VSADKDVSPSYEEYCVDYAFRPEFKPEFVSLWEGWLGVANLHKLDQVTLDEWGRFNVFLRRLAQRYTLFSLSHRAKSVTEVVRIDDFLSTHAQAMSKEAAQFSVFLIPELSCAVSESWDYTYIIWHKESGVVETLSPLIKACELAHFAR